MALDLTSLGFRAPKAGNSETDYEDAIAIGPTAVAIADGATESSFARAWAQALTEGFACEPLSPRPDLTELMERVAPMQQQWKEGIAWDRLPWYAEDKARNGAFAALLTLRFEEPLLADETGGGSVERRWHALAIGDTCLFQIRDDALHVAFPLSESGAFDSTPLLLSSNPARNLQVWDRAEALDGVFKSGDILLLMTDALAKWFLSEIEAGNLPWKTLLTLNSDGFTEMVGTLRAEHRLKNDDTSLICIRETSVVSTAASHALALPASGAEAFEAHRDTVPDVTASPPDSIAEGPPDMFPEGFPGAQEGEAK